MLMDIDDRISLILFEQASKFIDFDAYAQTHIIVTNSPRNIWIWPLHGLPLISSASMVFHKLLIHRILMDFLCN